MYLLTPRSRVERIYTTHPLVRRMRRQVGVTILKVSGLYREVVNDELTDEDIAAADAVYLGGHVYQIDNTTALEMTEAGYGEYIVEMPNPFGGGLYGQGLYGTGLYGD